MWKEHYQGCTAQHLKLRIAVSTIVFTPLICHLAQVHQSQTIFAQDLSLTWCA